MIDKQPIYLHRKLLRELENIALKGWSSNDRIGARIAGRAKAAEADTLMYQLLLDYSKKENFHDDYILFDLVEQDAVTETWDLLYDYCQFNGLGGPIDIRSSDDRLFSDLNGESYAFPVGQVFELYFPVKLHKRKRSWFKKKAKPCPAVRLTINMARVNRFSGKLNEFTMQYGSLVVSFDKTGMNILSPISTSSST